MKQFYDDITNFIFTQSDLQEADIILLPGAPWAEIAEAAARLYHSGLSSKILVSGKYGVKRGGFADERVSEKYRGQYETECDYLKAVLLEHRVPENAILLERESMNTMENAVMSKSSLEKAGIVSARAIVCCQAFHARRVMMTYSLVFDKTEILVHPVETQGINADNWNLTAYGIKRVMGELERCGKYFTDMIVTKIETEK